MGAQAGKLERQQVQEAQRLAAAREEHRTDWVGAGMADAREFISMAADEVPREMVVWALLRISSRVEMRDRFKNPTREMLHEWLRGHRTIDELRTMTGQKYAAYRAEYGHTVDRIRDEDPYQSWCLLRTTDAVSGAAADFVADLINKGYFLPSPSYALEEDGNVHVRGNLSWPPKPIPIPELLALLPFDLTDIGPAPKLWHPMLKNDPDITNLRIFSGEHVIFCRENLVKVLWVGDRTNPPEVSVLFDYLLERGGGDGHPGLIDVAEKAIWK